MCVFQTDRYYDDGCWLDDVHDTDQRPHLCGRRERAMNSYDHESNNDGNSHPFGMRITTLVYTKGCVYSYIQK